MNNPFYHSAEIRWFWSEQPGQWDALMKWLTQSGQIETRVEDKYDPKSPGNQTEIFVKAEKQRTDEYLLLPGAGTTSAKLRPFADLVHIIDCRLPVMTTSGPPFAGRRSKSGLGRCSWRTMTGEIFPCFGNRVRTVSRSTKHRTAKNRERES